MTRLPRTLLGRAGLAAAVVVALALGSLSASTAAPDPDELERARDRLMELERDFHLVAERYNALGERVAAIQGEIAQAASDVERLSHRMRARRAAAVEIAVELYKSGGDAGALEAVLSAESLAEADSRVSYLTQSQEAQRRVFEGLQSARAALDQRLAELERAQARAQRARAEIARLRAEIERKVAAQRDEIAELTAAIERAEAHSRARAARAAAAEPRPATPSRVPPVTAGNPNAQKAVDAALSQVGKPYRWGAAGPDAYDCSGLTMWAWARAGVSLPHNSQMQFDATPRVARDDWQPGDLLFFGNPIHHVGMYIGDGRMVEAPYTGSQVRVNSAHRSDYVGAGRPGV